MRGGAADSVDALPAQPLDGRLGGSPPAIQAVGLVKRYRDLVAVAGLDFQVQPRECFGLLGPNGAGKTTIVRLVSCVSPVSAGSLLVLGMDVSSHGHRIKARLGVVPQEPNLDPELSTLQNLLVYARYFDIPAAEARSRAWQALELWQLTEKARSKIDSLSGGMKKRALLARGLINQPELLVLDEPTLGLDPQARHLVWQRLRLLKAQGVTTLLSTNNMEEAALLCDRLLILHRGRVLAVGVPADLVAEHVGREVYELGLDGESDGTRRLLTQQGLAWEDVGDTVYVFRRDGQALAPEMLARARRVHRRPATLEDVFLRLTGRGLQE
ncbi:MAG: ATP-binding cassette domain-containing protein [Chloroflexi bacterium]|nr:ATP-binding cassette domain-containing protein [Chloroflexota bacterium]